MGNLLLKGIFGKNGEVVIPEVICEQLGLRKGVQVILEDRERERERERGWDLY